MRKRTLFGIAAALILVGFFLMAFKVERLTGIVLVAAGLVTVVVALRRKRRDPSEADPQPAP